VSRKAFLSLIHSLTALRYNAPVLLNSVYVLMMFDDKDQLIAKRSFD